VATINKQWRRADPTHKTLKIICCCSRLVVATLSIQKAGLLRMFLRLFLAPLFFFFLWIFYRDMQLYQHTFVTRTGLILNCLSGAYFLGILNSIFLCKLSYHFFYSHRDCYVCFRSSFQDEILPRVTRGALRGHSFSHNLQSSLDTVFFHFYGSSRGYNLSVSRKQNLAPSYFVFADL
jgi:hypothetical protein